MIGEYNYSQTVEITQNDTSAMAFAAVNCVGGININNEPTFLHIFQ